MLTDLLDNLEWYTPLYPKMQAVIDILDRSIPYDDEPGEHQVDGVSYKVATYLTDEVGMVNQAKGSELHMVLEGAELFSLQQDGQPVAALHLSSGIFVIVHKDEQYRSAQDLSGSAVVKKAIFRLSE